MPAIVRDWEIRTEGGPTGIELAFSRLGGEHEVVLAYALPPTVDVWVLEDGSRLAATGCGLHDDTAATPISQLRIDGRRIVRRNVWPTENDVGLPVILPGGETGILRRWDTDDERTTWRWTVEFAGNATRR